MKVAFDVGSLINSLYSELIMVRFIKFTLIDGFDVLRTFKLRTRCVIEGRSPISGGRDRYKDSPLR
jgi:hypothetical protein